ncbi:hypothetical protein CJ030_MR7G000817 [Morella rubra]|uniref:Uncharacterized protein n=1 Tax=Morella rubra TaxID=262757 RepID=A0A6A1V5J2_9ROSI|nr:hypothetical protein CJ030_MR7G000817 [Morella rubra]
MVQGPSAPEAIEPGDHPKCQPTRTVHAIFFIYSATCPTNFKRMKLLEESGLDWRRMVYFDQIPEPTPTK